MEFLANIDPQGFSEGLGDAAENAVKLAEASGQFADREAIYAKEATKLFKDSLTPLQVEYIENQERIAEIERNEFVFELVEQETLVKKNSML